MTVNLVGRIDKITVATHARVEITVFVDGPSGQPIPLICGDAGVYNRPIQIQRLNLANQIVIGLLRATIAVCQNHITRTANFW